MDASSRTAATHDFLQFTRGDPAAGERLLTHVYAELRALAGGYLRHEANGHTLQPTALVHEAWIRLIDGQGFEWRGHAQFRALAATAMRHVLADHARGRKAQKRGDGARRVTLLDPATPAAELPVDLVELNEVLDDLLALDPRQHRIVEMRFFGGLSVVDVASVLECSTTTVEREWRAARAWLGARLRPSRG